MMRRLGIGTKEQRLYEQMEKHFQDYIRDNTIPVRDLLCGYRIPCDSDVRGGGAF